MIDKKEKTLSRLVDRISKQKIDLFCSELENNDITLSDDLFLIKKKLQLTSIEEKYFTELISEFSNKDDLILLLKLMLKNNSLVNQNKKNTSLAWSSPIKFHKKIEQTYSVFQRMINNAKENGSIIFVGYAMTDEENEDIWNALKDAVENAMWQLKSFLIKPQKQKN